MNYRWIEGWTATDKEWDELDLILASRGWMAINRDTSRILVAEEGKELAGFIILQMVPHTEPLWVGKKYYGTGVAEELADKMMRFMNEIHARGWMAIAESPIAEKLCKERGMAKVEFPVYVMVGNEKVAKEN